MLILYKLIFWYADYKKFTLVSGTLAFPITAKDTYDSLKILIQLYIAEIKWLH